MRKSDGKSSLWARCYTVLREELGVGTVHPRLLLVNGIVHLLPYMAARRIKAALYRAGGIRIGPKTLIYGPLHLFGQGDIARRLQVGEHCRINSPCSIDLTGPVVLGDRVVLGYNVALVTAKHQIDDPRCRAGAVYGQPITIGDGAWLGASVIVLPGVSIGAGAIVGARSVVTRDVPPHTFVAGNPARPLRVHLPGAGCAPGCECARIMAASSYVHA